MRNMKRIHSLQPGDQDTIHENQDTYLTKSQINKLEKQKS